MAKVNRFPAGYLDMLQAKTGGRSPPEASDIVMPTIEMSDFYQSQLLANVNDTLNHSAAGNVLNTRVPPGQFWLLWGCSVLTSLSLVADFERWTLRLRELPRGDLEDAGGFPGIWTSRLLQVQAINQQSQDSNSFARPYPLGPGVELSMQVAERDASAARVSRIQYAVTQFLA